MEKWNTTLDQNASLLTNEPLFKQTWLTRGHVVQKAYSWLHSDLHFQQLPLFLPHDFSPSKFRDICYRSNKKCVLITANTPCTATGVSVQPDKLSLFYWSGHSKIIEYTIWFHAAHGMSSFPRNIQQQGKKYQQALRSNIIYYFIT